MTITVFTSPAVLEIEPQVTATISPRSNDTPELGRSRSIVLEDLDSSPRPSSRQAEKRPGLHGRARIWGPNRTIRMILLTTALMGLQFTWSVEMAYGTPFLLQLGLSKSLMSLVWLAGPLSGLVMQPIVGVLSDRCTSKLGRRRPFLIVGVVAVVISFFFLGWCKEVMTVILGAGYAKLETATILMAVGSIYVLDFAINCVQASCRTLIVDSLPSSQQETAASWASRLMGIGGILGYFMGNVDLPKRVPFFGDTQIKGLCVIANLFLVFCVGLTCLTVTERVVVRPRNTKAASNSFVHEFLQGFKSIYQSIRHLPTRIQHLCNVQFFAWMGWFPFLFYSSTYIAEIYTQEQFINGTPVVVEPNTGPGLDSSAAGVRDAAVRAGSFCLLVYSVVSLAASIVLPVLTAPAASVQTTSVSSGPFGNQRSMTGFADEIGRKRGSKWQGLNIPRWARPPIKGLTLPRLYTLSLALASFSWISTLYVHDLWGSTILFSCCGVAWAVSMWAPFSILGEVISQRMQEEQHQERLRVSRPQSHHSNSNGVGLDSIQVVYPKEGEGGGGYYGEGGESDSEGEEIGMVEGRSVAGSRYLPVRARESQDEVITVSSSSKNAVPITLDSFRSRTGTPSPTTLEGPSLPNETVGWTVQGKDFAHVDTDSETEDTSGGESSQDKSRHYHSNMNEDERRLVPKRSHHYRHQYPASTHHQHSKRKGSGNRPEGRTNPSNRRGNDPIRFSGAHPGQETPSSSSLPVSATSESSSAGALLGIHNIYIVLPQFLVSFLSSVVFAAIEPKNRQEEPSSAVGAGGDTLAAPGDPDTIGVMLRFGGIMAGIAAVLSLRLWKQPRVAQS